MTYTALECEIAECGTVHRRWNRIFLRRRAELSLNGSLDVPAQRTALSSDRTRRLSIETRISRMIAGEPYTLKTSCFSLATHLSQDAQHH